MRTSPISLSRPARVLVNDDTLAQKALDVAGLALQGLDDLERQLVGVLGIERLEHRFEAVEQHVQVQRVLRALERDRASGRSSAAAPSGPWARTRYRWPTRFRNRNVAVVFWVSWTSGSTPKVTSALSFWTISTLLIEAHGHAGDAHVIALGHAGDVGEDCLVLVLRAEAAVAQREGQQNRGHAGGLRRR